MTPAEIAAAIVSVLLLVSRFVQSAKAIWHSVPKPVAAPIPPVIELTLPVVALLREVKTWSDLITQLIAAGALHWRGSLRRTPRSRCTVRERTAVDRYFKEQMQDPGFAEGYDAERVRNDAIDATARRQRSQETQLQAVRSGPVEQAALTQRLCLRSSGEDHRRITRLTASRSAIK